MKTTLLGLFALCSCVNIFAQNDTLLFEDFQDEFTITDIPDPDVIDTWFDIDLDQISPDPASGIEDGGWFWSEDFKNFRLDTIIGDTNFVYASNSWLTDFNPNNRNWLVTPPIPIIDDQASLHFKSAPYQLPRYMDKLSVYVSTKGPFPDGWSPGTPDQPGEFEDLLFESAEMESFITDGQTTELSEFVFSDGYFHASMMTDSTYFLVEDSTLNWGTLEPHSVSLAAFANKQIYIAFVHNSADDYRVMVDDILVLGNLGVLNNDDLQEDNFQLVTYPNPVDNFLNVMFKLDQKANIGISLHDTKGSIVLNHSKQQFPSGEQNLKLDLRNLSSGSYILQLKIDDKLLSKKIMVK